MADQLAPWIIYRQRCNDKYVVLPENCGSCQRVPDRIIRQVDGEPLRFASEAEGLNYLNAHLPADWIDPADRLHSGEVAK